MRWVDYISILTILLSGSTFLLISGTDDTDINGYSPSSALLLAENGHTALLDTVLSVDAVGLITSEGEPTEPTPSDSTPSSETLSEPAHSDVTPPPSSPCVNINTADERQLVTLRGIGPATAASIIEYRNRQGAFRRIEDIQGVRGIGPAKFAQIADDICL